MQRLARSLPRGHPAEGNFCARRWQYGVSRGRSARTFVRCRHCLSLYVRPDCLLATTAVPIHPGPGVSRRAVPGGWISGARTAGAEVHPAPPGLGIFSGRAPDACRVGCGRRLSAGSLAEWMERPGQPRWGCGGAAADTVFARKREDASLWLDATAGFSSGENAGVLFFADSAGFPELRSAAVPGSAPISRRKGL